MLVSHRKKFIFIKTLKTAGTSIESFFEKYCFPDGDWTPSHWRDEYISTSGIVGYRVGGRGTKVPGDVTFSSHMAASEVKACLPKDVWENYFKFTVVRNPFDKLVSAFYHFEKARKPEKYAGRKESDVTLFREWVAGGGSVIDRNIYMIDGSVAVDYFIRYESLADGIAGVCSHLNIKDFEISELPKFKSEFRDRRLGLIDMYDCKTKDIVRQKYKFEIDFFGYELE